MIEFQVITLFPDYFKSALKQGLIFKAIQQDLIKIHLINPRDFSESKTSRVDDCPFGGGDGLIMNYQPLEQALKSLETRGHTVYLNPQGSMWNYKKAQDYARKHSRITIVCGRYGGIDQRFIQDYVDEEISIGDYILNGAEAAFLVLLESVFRFIPGALGNEQSSKQESFEQDGLLEGPQWTRPQVIGDHIIPSVIFSGNHKLIKEFRRHASLVLTSVKRPSILKNNKKLLKELTHAQKELSKLSLKELQSLGCQPEDLKLILTS